MSTKASEVKSAAKPAPAAVAPASPPPVAAKVNLVKKITLKSVCGTIPKPETAKALFTVVGIAHGLKTGQSNFGPFIGFVGSFKAKNLETGESYVAGTCYLPKVVEELLASSMRSIQEQDASASVQFAFEVGVKPHPTSPVGYEIVVKPLVELARNDALEMLDAAVNTPRLENKG